jgi:hypothetical protein
MVPWTAGSPIPARTSVLVVKKGEMYASYADKIEYVLWKRYNGIDPGSQRVKKGDKFERLSSKEQRIGDAMSTYTTEVGLLKMVTRDIGTDLSKQLVETLMYYSLWGEAPAAAEATTAK